MLPSHIWVQSFHKGKWASWLGPSQPSSFSPFLVVCLYSYVYLNRVITLCFSLQVWWNSYGCIYFMHYLISEESLCVLSGFSFPVLVFHSFLKDHTISFIFWECSLIYSWKIIQGCRFNDLSLIEIFISLYSTMYPDINTSSSWVTISLCIRLYYNDIFKWFQTEYR